MAETRQHDSYSDSGHKTTCSLGPAVHITGDFAVCFKTSGSTTAVEILCASPAVVPEAHSRAAERVVEQVEGHQRRQAQQEDDLPALVLDGVLDGLPPVVALRELDHVLPEEKPAQRQALCTWRVSS